MVGTTGELTVAGWVAMMASMWKRRSDPRSTALSLAAQKVHCWAGRRVDKTEERLVAGWE